MKKSKPKLTFDQAVLIRLEAENNGVVPKNLAKKYGVSARHIRRIIRGESHPSSWDTWVKVRQRTMLAEAAEREAKAGVERIGRMRAQRNYEPITPRAEAMARGWINRPRGLANCGCAPTTPAPAKKSYAPELVGAAIAASLIILIMLIWG